MERRMGRFSEGQPQRRPSELIFPRDPEKRRSVVRKIAAFREAGPGQVQVVLDFDKTVTEHPTILGHLTSHLPEKVRDEQFAISRQNYVLEAEGKLTPEIIDHWWKGPLNLYAEHRLDFVTVASSFVELAQPRPGVTEAFETKDSLGIPSFFLSSGVYDMIAVWCQTHNILPASIIATKLKVEDGLIVGWEEDTLVSPLNKKARLAEALAQNEDKRPFTIVVGDSVHDAESVDGEENVLRIRMRDESTAGKMDPEEYERQTFEHFDLLLNGDFVSFVDLLSVLTMEEYPEPLDPRRVHAGYAAALSLSS